MNLYALGESAEPFMAVVYVTYSNGSNLKGCYSAVHGGCTSCLIEHVKIVTRMKYGFMYTNRSEAGVDRYELELVPLQPQQLDG